jgi:hypothetical protein
MTQTKDFRNMLKRFRRNFGMEFSIERAEQFARENEIQILQPRKKYTNKFKRQRSAFDFSGLDSFE